jgi:hypothetical protein
VPSRIREANKKSSTFGRRVRLVRNRTFLAEVSSDGSKLIYSGHYPEATMGQDVAVDSAGNVLALGFAGTLTKLNLAAGTAPALVGAANSAGGPFTNLGITVGLPMAKPSCAPEKFRTGETRSAVTCY